MDQILIENIAITKDRNQDKLLNVAETYGMNRGEISYGKRFSILRQQHPKLCETKELENQ